MKKALQEAEVAFENGEVEYVIIGFDKTLGMGGEKAVLAFDDLQLDNSDKDAPKFKLSAAQAQQFEQYKKTRTN